MIEKYWGSERVYHHTAPISMNYALHEALRIVLEEGLEKAWQRHKQVHETFIREMHKLEIDPAIDEPAELPTKRPSSRARRRAMSSASAVLTARISSARAGSHSGGA